MNAYPSWGNYPAEKSAQVVLLNSIEEPWPKTEGKLLPRGLGRSYGDSCLNNMHTLMLTKNLNRILEFDPRRGEIICESGVTLEQVISLTASQGWFLPVTPGTKFVSVGGAVANDVHGKNHHKAGTFGRYVNRFEIRRSDGEQVVCSRDENKDLFQATIGGIGLTGLILWVSFQLKRIDSTFIKANVQAFDNLDKFLAISKQNETCEYSVSWVDSMAKGKKLGRGIFISGNHAGSIHGFESPHGKSKSVPFYFPSWTLNRLSVSAFNLLYYNRKKNQEGTQYQHYDPFFYPLDNIHDWNRIYGRRGFIQYQCVIPPEADYRVLLERISESGFASFLSVIKLFGNFPSEGILSFPMEGFTIAMDFPVKKEIFSFLNKMDQLVIEMDGRVYIAKDARMSRESFEAFYPNINRFLPFVDPAFSSSFWRRVTTAT